MTIGLMGPFEKSQNTVTRYDNLVFMQEVGPITFPVLLVDQDRFQALLKAFVDIAKLLWVLNLSEPL